MAKRTILAVIAVFLAWSILDFFIHGLTLRPTCEATANLWDPMAEMKMALVYFVTLLFSISFVTIYRLMVEPKTLQAGIKFGILFGLAADSSMGFGSYSYMPIPLSLAWS